MIYVTNFIIVHENDIHKLKNICSEAHIYINRDKLFAIYEDFLVIFHLLMIPEVMIVVTINFSKHSQDLLTSIAMLEDSVLVSIFQGRNGTEEIMFDEDGIQQNQNSIARFLVKKNRETLSGT